MWSTFWSLIGVHIAALIVPGPDFALVSRNALCHGRKAGWATALGIASGLLISIGVIVTALNLWQEQIPFLLHIVRYVGAGFLLYLAYRALTRKADHHLTDAHLEGVKLRQHSSFSFFASGVLCNATNPKALFFLISIFGVGALELSMQMQTVLIGAMWLTCAGWFGIVAHLLTGSYVKAFSQRVDNLQLYVTRASGCLFVLFAIALLLH